MDIALRGCQSINILSFTVTQTNGIFVQKQLIFQYVQYEVDNRGPVLVNLGLW